jgi:adenine deaminase
MFHVEQLFIIQKLYFMKVLGQLVDIHSRDIYPVVMTIQGDLISGISRTPSAPPVYILPGLTDAHIHIESSMITPGAFAATAIGHGTVAVVSDPHEIANVVGIKGVDYMIEDGRRVPLKFYFGAPSCVPATEFESSGAHLDSKDVAILLGRPEIHFLSEMMNYPGVIFNDKEVFEKLRSAGMVGKPVDGHAPGLSGEALVKYVSAGISTDHECSTIEEAKEKIGLGMKILMREGSAAKNLDALKELFNTHPDMIMLCSDDLHPEMLQKGHINLLVSRLINEGYDMFDVVRSATINPKEHYGLDTGLLRKGDRADFIIVDDLEGMNVKETWIDGNRVYSDGRISFEYKPGQAINNFNCGSITEEKIKVTGKGRNMQVIEAFDGSLETKRILFETKEKIILPDLNQDILKIVVKERYKDCPPATGFIKGFGLKAGAFASSIAHDSHNIISVGTNDRDIVAAINEIVKHKGGLAVAVNGDTFSLPLDIAGIMTTRSCGDVASDYVRLSDLVRSLGCTMSAPFMTLSFMALLVIPELKISDRGLFDVMKFQPVPLFVE